MNNDFVQRVTLILVLLIFFINLLGVLFNVSIIDDREPNLDLNVLSNLDSNSFKEHLALAQNQQAIFNALVLNELGVSGCIVSNYIQIDQNTLGVSLLCPAQQGVN